MSLPAVTYHPLDIPFDFDTSLYPQLHPKPTLPRKPLLKHLDSDDYLLEIDNTSLESFLACDRAAKFRLVDGRVSYTGAAINYGKAVHAGLEYLYLHGADYAQMLSRGEAILSSSPPAPGEWRNSEALARTFREYLKTYAYEPFTVYQHAGQSCVEQPFSLHLGEIKVEDTFKFPRSTLVTATPSEGQSDSDSPNLYIRTLQISWTGVIDLIIQQNDNLWVVDHKTSSILGDSYFKGFELSQQFAGYVYAASKILNQPIRGALLNVLAGRKETKSGKALELLRRYYPYPEWLLSEWEKDIMTLVSDFVHRLTTGFFPKKTLWCVGKFGTCPYHSVCSSSPDTRDLLLGSDVFTDNSWDPLKK